MIVRQLPLPINLDSDATFHNFITLGAARQEAVVQLQKQHHLVYLWGESGSGCSHLLQAVCHHFDGQYLPLAELISYQPEWVLDGLELQPRVCIDQLQAIEASPQWQHALFHFYNRYIEGGGQLIVAAQSSPFQLGVVLEDLRSRLASGITMHLSPYSETERVEVLTFRARCRGLELSEEVAQFLLARIPRSLRSIMDALDRLDATSMTEQRKLTIPFVKQTLGL